MPPSDRTATSVVPPPTSTIIDPVGSVTGHAAPFDRGRARRHADDDLRAGKAAPIVNLADEMLDHLLRHLEIGDDAIAQRTDRLDAARRAAEHEDRESL